MAFLEKEYQAQIENIYRNWLANSAYYEGDTLYNDTEHQATSA